MTPPRVRVPGRAVMPRRSPAPRPGRPRGPGRSRRSGARARSACRPRRAPRPARRPVGPRADPGRGEGGGRRRGRRGPSAPAAAARRGRGRSGSRRQDRVNRGAGRRRRSFARPRPRRYPAPHARGRRAHPPAVARPPGASWAPPPVGGACRHPRPDAPGTNASKPIREEDPPVTAHDEQDAERHRTPTQRVLIFDTTLRDGEQAPGITLNTREKVEIGQQLARLGVDVIEAGFPIASPGDFEGVRAVAQEVPDVDRGRPRPRQRARRHDGGRGRARRRPARIHTFIATSDIHLTYKLKMARPGARRGDQAVRLARTIVDDVEFSCEDATRSDVAFVAEVVGAAIAEGATTINIPDTVGYTMPTEFQRFLLDLYERCPSPARRGAVGALPQRPRPGRRQLPVRRPGGRAAGRGLRQRHRRARGQRQHRGAGDDPAHPRRRAGRPLVRHEHHRDHAHQQDGQPHDRLRGAAQQGDRGPQRLRPRGRHPPARRAEQPADLRDHGLRLRRPRAERDRARQALRPPRAAQRAGRDGLRAGQGGARPGVRALQGRWPTARAASRPPTSRRSWATR